jgi:hypothetical protein
VGGTPLYVEILGGVGEGGCRLWGWSVLVLVAQLTRRIGIDVGRWRIGVCVCLTFQ